VSREPPCTGTIPDPDKRLRKALLELYSYYDPTELMLDNVLRDEATMPILTELLGRFRGYMAAVHEILMTGRPNRGAACRRTAAALNHALEFATWRSLTGNKLSNREAANLMVELVAAARINKTSIRLIGAEVAHSRLGQCAAMALE